MIDPDSKEKSRLTKEEWREYTLTSWSVANVQHPVHPAAFAEEIPMRLLKLFSFHGETVLDPFAGSGTTGRVAWKLGRNSILVDQSEEYFNLMKEEFGHNLFVAGAPQVVHGDARNLKFLDNDSIPLIVTSPPYWDKADYGPKEENLGRTLGYIEFLDAIKPAFEECARVLMPGRKFCIVTANVNQHTDHGLLTFPIAADFILMMREIGLPLVSEVIWTKNGTGGKWGSHGEQRPIFGSYPFPPNLMFKNVHEHILVFIKPREKPIKGKTVRGYNELMKKRG